MQFLPILRHLKLVLGGVIQPTHLILVLIDRPSPQLSEDIHMYDIYIDIQVQDWLKESLVLSPHNPIILIEEPQPVCNGMQVAY